MLSANADFKNSAKQPVKVTRVVVTQQTFEDPFEYTSDDDLMSVSIDAVGRFLGTATKRTTIKLLGIHPEFLEQTVNIQLGIQNVSDGTWDYVDFGNFFYYDMEFDYEADSTTVTMYDAMYGAIEALEQSLDITFPQTVQALATAVASSMDLTLDAGFTSLPNYDYEIQEDIYDLIDGVTVRDVILEIAQATATTAIVSGSVLKFVPKSASVETMTSTNLKKLKIGDRYGVINSVVLARVPQEDNIVVTDDASVDTNGLTEFRIVNNQILDDDRETLITPIFTALDGVYFDGANAETEGHGWYEVGDSITITQGADTYEPLITEIHLVLDGGVKETLVCLIPDPTQTNYATAGGILKTIYNTELKTDKQNQEIIAVVSELATLGDEVAENYSQVIQDINSVTNTFQTTGGNNIIHNSVGYATETDGTPSVWEFTGVGEATANTSPESVAYGAVSANQINLSGASPKLKQRVLVQTGGLYSVSIRFKKSATGSATLRLYNDTDSFELEALASTAYLWNEFSLVGFTPTLGYLDVEIESDGAVDFSWSDLMLVTGDSTTVWQQANGEILNTQVSLNSEGIKVKSNIFAGDFTQITPLEFAGYSSISGTQEKVFSLNRDTTQVKKLEVESQIDMPPIKVVPILSGANAGWAFVVME